MRCNYALRLAPVEAGKVKIVRLPSVRLRCSRRSYPHSFFRLQICLSVPTRDHIQCLQRWQKVLDPSLRKGFWSPEEDALLVRLKVAADAAAPPGRGRPAKTFSAILLRS